MKKFSLAFAAAAVTALVTLSTPVEAQPYHRDGYRPPVVVVVQPPPRRVVVRNGYYRHARGPYYRHGRRDSDRDGVPDRFDRRPNNPYRR